MISLINVLVLYLAITLAPDNISQIHIITPRNQAEIYFKTNENWLSNNKKYFILDKNNFVISYNKEIVDLTKSYEFSADFFNSRIKEIHSKLSKEKLIFKTHKYGFDLTIQNRMYLIRWYTKEQLTNH